MSIQTPNWVKNAVFYQIFPDRFAKAEPPKDAQYQFQTVEFEPWEDPPTLQGYKGGNLWGVIEKLDYLQELGITALYLTPIFQSACNHRYHTHDYYRVDPILGGNEALDALLKAAHQRNVKVILDGVFNHASRGFFYFNDILENGPYSPWLDWFKIFDWPVSAYNGDLPANYAGWVGNRALPEFNHENPDVREYIMQVGEYWIQQGIDGWRLDVPYEINVPGFWEEFRERVKNINPEAYIVGEVWDNAQYWLDGNQFDAVMNYVFTGPTIAFTARDRVDRSLVEQPAYKPYPAQDASDYAEHIEHLLALYPWEIQLTQFNLLASHDTARLLSIAQRDRASVKLATLLLLTFPGAPCIYYGDEVGLPGKLDPDSRRSFPPKDEWDEELWQWHQDLIRLRHSYPALRTGDYKILHAEGLVYVFARTLAASELIIAVNSGTENASVEVPTDKLQSEPRRLLYGEAELQWDSNRNTLSLQLPPRQGCVIGN
jgi:glycosidase